jgi:hypothetical protein
VLKLLVFVLPLGLDSFAVAAAIGFNPADEPSAVSAVPRDLARVASARTTLRDDPDSCAALPPV